MATAREPCGLWAIGAVREVTWNGCRDTARRWCSGADERQAGESTHSACELDEAAVVTLRRSFFLQTPQASLDMIQQAAGVGNVPRDVTRVLHQHRVFGFERFVFGLK